MATSWYSFRSERRSKRSRSPKSRDRSQSRDRSRERRDRSRGRGRDSSRDRRPTKSYNERKGLAFNIRISRNFIIRGLFWSQNSRNEESNTLAIFNLYYKTDQDELRRIFERYGKIEVSFRLFWPILVEPVEASGELRHHTTHFFRNVTLWIIEDAVKLLLLDFWLLKILMMQEKPRKMLTEWKSMATCKFNHKLRHLM